MPNLNGQDDAIRQILQESRTIAVVGHSDKPERTSYQIAQFLRQVGYTVIPVNPIVSMIDHTLCYERLTDIPVAVDIVNVFRRSEYLPEIVEQAIAIGAPTVWAQLGVSNHHALQTALAAGQNIIMDACIKIEYARLGIVLP